LRHEAEASPSAAPRCCFEVMHAMFDRPPAAASPNRSRRHTEVARRWLALALLTVLGAAGMAVLLARLQALPLPEAAGARLPCISYAPFRRDGHDPFDPAVYVDASSIEADLRLLAGVTGCVRTYGVDRGLEAVPAIARKLGLRVVLGAWIGRDAAANEDQLARALKLARAYADVIELLVVGNEVLLRRELAPRALAQLLARARRESPVPVAYADVWEFWLRHAPQLRDHVDRVAVHVLPYWEDQPVANAEAAAYVHSVARRLRETLAPLPVWVAETGWPAEGRQRGPAVPGHAEQARFVREMLARERAAGAQALGFNLIEGFDQPWKRRLEGAMGGYWGFFDAHGRARVTLAGPVPRAHEVQPLLWAASIGLGVGVVLALALRARLRAGAQPAPASRRRGAVAYVWTFALALAALAACAWLQWQAVQVWSRSEWETAMAVLLSAVAAGAALAELPGLARHLAGEARDDLRPGFVAAWTTRASLSERMCSALVLALLFFTAVAALHLVFDGRYRPLLWPMVWVPAALWLASALLGRRFGPEAREERLLAQLCALAAAVLLWREGLANGQAVLTALSWFALALAGLRAQRQRLPRATGALVAQGGPAAGQQPEPAPWSAPRPAVLFEAPGPRSRPWLPALAVALFAGAINFTAWRALNPPIPAVDVPARVAGLAYNAFQRHNDPFAQRLPDSGQIEADLRLLAPLTPRLRTYSAAELPQLPALAERQGMKLALGVWLDRRFENNEREIAAAIDAARRHRNVERLIAGNETQLHRALTPAELRAALARLRRACGVPVSTAEPWHVWLGQPELAEHVDFITVHLLPYWEGVPLQFALGEAMRRYREVRERFPHKQVVIGEIGWPSGGPPIQAPRWSPQLEITAPAVATPAAQAQFVRAFVDRAAREGLDYYLMEATDQPWKRATEGRAGAHWGVLDAARRPKFAFSGPVQNDPHWHSKAALSSVLGLFTAAAVLLAFRTLRWPGRWLLALSVQAVATFAVVLAASPLVDYLRHIDLAVLALLVPALALLAAILLVQVIEFAEMHWPQCLRGRAAPRPVEPPASALNSAPTPAHPAGASNAPFVSLHLPCCNEPPQQVIAAIDSLLALDWPEFEVLVIDNNTVDPSRWRPVQAHVESLQQSRLGKARVRFFHLPRWPGYKAGALNFALSQTDARAQWVGVVDADYAVDPGWLRQLGGWFTEPGVAVVQAPQAHRDWQGRRFDRMMNWEYDGFFRIGMHHRHERNAVIQHGTMTLVRAAALRHAGGWSEDCICEDTELGLRLLEQGARVVYVDRVLGTGLVPADFAAYAGQRTRWAEGGMQILRCHARELFAPRRTRLSLAQRYHFIAGWLPWIGDAAHLAFSLAAMVWTVAALLAPQHAGPPIALFLLPLVVFFAARLAMTPLLYRRLVPCSAGSAAGAALAGMALSHSVARGVVAGLAGRRSVFRITRRGAAGGMRHGVPLAQLLGAAREEAALLAGLAACALGVLLHPYFPAGARGGWTLVLALQALPYAAALGCAQLAMQGRAEAAARPYRQPAAPATEMPGAALQDAAAPGGD
jgi:exo-beta-1,3-glucanase (GH17 family)/cellulose synthase/poly-beta-1,6-N-acetylglucosamine synthase-like glycosyltransferase